MGKGLRLYKLLSKYFVDEQDNPLNEDTIEQAQIRIKNGVYPRKKEELDNLIKCVVEAN